MASLICLNKKLCDIAGILTNLLGVIEGGVTVDAGEGWQDLITAAINAANIEVTIGNQPISVVIDTAGGPVEVTGTLAVTQSGDWTVSVDNFPTSISIDNFNVLEDLTLSVIVGNEEPIPVSLDGTALAALADILNAINNTIRTDWEETGMCVANADGSMKEPCVRQYMEIKYSNTGVKLSTTPVLSIFNEDGTISGYELAEGEKVVKCVTNAPCVLLGTLNKCIIPPTGMEVRHWFTDNNGEAGNAVAHDEIDVVFPSGIHASGQPADSVAIVNNWTFNDNVGGVSQGASQTYAKGEVIFTEDVYIDDINQNTGEFIIIKIDGVVVNDNTALTETVNRGAFLTPKKISAGKHLVEVFISDLSVFGGLNLVNSPTLEGEYVATPAYAEGSVTEKCIKVEKCNGVLRDCITGEQIIINELDKWIECAQLDKLCKIEDLLSSVIGSPDDDCNCTDDNSCAKFNGEYQLTGTETDLTYSSNETGLKWDASSINPIATAFTKLITDCIDAGGKPTITYSDGGADTLTFVAESYTGIAGENVFFTGTAGPITGSGKLDNASTTCEC